jgi:hypothetical protein
MLTALVGLDVIADTTVTLFVVTCATSTTEDVGTGTTIGGVCELVILSLSRLCVGHFDFVRVDDRCESDWVMCCVSDLLPRLSLLDGVLIPVGVTLPCTLTEVVTTGLVV